MNFGLLAVLGVDDLVLAVLVAVGAGQVALVRDVEHHRRAAETALRRHRRRRATARGDARSRSRARRSSSSIAARIVGGSNRSASDSDELVAGDRRSVERRRSTAADVVVEREDRGARHEIQEAACPPPRTVKLARRERNHGCDLRLIELDVERHGDEQVRARLERPRRVLCRRGGVERSPPPTRRRCCCGCRLALRIRTVEVRREQSRCRSIVPTNSMSSSSYVAVYSSMRPRRVHAARARCRPSCPACRPGRCCTRWLRTAGTVSGTSRRRRAPCRLRRAP